MAGTDQVPTVGQLPTPESRNDRVPAVLTRLAWLLWVVSLGVAAAYGLTGGGWEIDSIVAVDGLTVVMWTTATFFSGIVHSYSRRYMAGNRTIDRFFLRVFAFTLAVAVLVVANHLLLFWAAWLAMGLVMSGLVGHVDGWPQARAAGSLARRYFLAGSGLLGLALLALWRTTGTTTLGDVPAAVESMPTTIVVLVAGLVLLAAMIQSALIPFHGWLLSSMTAPTPASALMHAGFVNAGGILLLRFAPVVTVEDWVLLVVVIAGAASALGGKLFKTVQTDVKGALGCSTIGQMGFMIMQAGLGFFGAALTHLVLHGFYKAYQFLSSGERVEHEAPVDAGARRSWGLAGVIVAGVTALLGGGLFALLTGKGTEPDSGLLLTLLVVLTVLHAVREITARGGLPTSFRYAAVPAIALPAIAVYAGVYRLIDGLIGGLPAVGDPAELTVVHGVVAAAFLVAYLAVGTGVYRRSRRLYVTLLNVAHPSSTTLLTDTEDYNEY